MDIKVLYYEECPSHDQALDRLKQVLADEDVTDPIEVIKVETEEQAQQWRFVGSPTILLDGEDIVPPPADASFHLTCRAYRLENGRISPLPSVETIRRAVQSHKPGG